MLSYQSSKGRFVTWPSRPHFGPNPLFQPGGGAQVALSGQCQYHQEMDPTDRQLAGDPQPVGYSLRGSVFPMSLAASFLPRIAFALRASRVATLPPLTPAVAQAGWFERLSGQFIIFEWCRLHKLLHAISDINQISRGCRPFIPRINETSLP